MSNSCLHRSALRLHRTSTCCVALACLALLVLGTSLYAKVPDLTKGDKPTPMRKSKDGKLLIGNLGPTGMKGWVYTEGIHTSNSRQILITEVAKGSPADGVLKVGDVILGASGTQANPSKFTTDARKSFALAIGEAEAKSPARLNMLIWRDGRTATRSITLQTLGAYSDTAPYNCPKSMKIIENTLKYLDKNELKRDRFGLNILALVACNDDRFAGNAERMKRAQEWIIEMLPEQKYLDSMTSDKVETFSKIAWNRTYMLIVLAEYYLATGDNPSKNGIDLLTAIDAHAQTVARGQSMFGTMGHQFAMQGEDGSIHGPYAVGYGPVNATGLAAFLGLTLARECNLPNPETRAAIDAGIERAGNFFSSYVGRGSIPYGEHPPWTKSHASNGKNGLAAVAFARAPERREAGQFFSKVAVSAGSERVGGHGGAYFNYLWSPLGANAGGPEAGAAHFKDIAWHLDLSRTWDGGFFYHDFGNPGYNGDRFGKASLYMSTPSLLTYAMPLAKLRITGHGLDATRHLTSAQVADAATAGSYRPAGRTTQQLIDDLGNYSFVMRNKAANALAAQPDVKRALPKLHAIAQDASDPARVGAIAALGAIGDPSSAAVLSGLFTDPKPLVRDTAVEAFKAMPQDVQDKHVDTLLKMTAALRRPSMKVNAADPVNTTLLALSDLLFDKKGILGSSLKPVDKYSSREQLYDAIRAVATLPSGGERGKLKFVFDLLKFEDVKALRDTLLDLVYVEAPADAMFAEGIRSSAMQLLLKHHTVEGVQASVDLFKVGGRWTKVVIIRTWADIGPSVTKIDAGKPIPDLLRSYNDKKFKNEAKKALDAFAKNKKPAVTFKPLK